MKKILTSSLLLGLLGLASCLNDDDSSTRTQIHNHIDVSDHTDADSIVVNWTSTSGLSEHIVFTEYSDNEIVPLIDVPTGDEISLQVRVYKDGNVVATLLDEIDSKKRDRGERLQVQKLNLKPRITINDTLDFKAIFQKHFELDSIQCTSKEELKSLSSCSWNFPETGKFQFDFNIYLPGSNSVSEKLNLEVIQGAPKLDAPASQKVEVMQVQTLKIDASDSNDGIYLEDLIIRWDFDGDEEWDTTGTNLKELNFKFPDSPKKKSYSTIIQIEDNDKNIKTDTISIILQNTKPKIHGEKLSASKVTLNDKVLISLDSIRDINENLVDSIFWDLDNSGKYKTATKGSILRKETSFDKAGKYKVSAFIKDTWNTRDTIRLDLQVVDGLPIVSIGVDTIVKLHINESYSFDATASDPNIDSEGSLIYRWDFDNDGTWDYTSETSAKKTYAGGICICSIIYIHCSLVL